MKYDITYFEMIQISIEAMGAAFCIVSIIALLAYGKTKVTNSIVKLLLFNTIMQISDACAYIFRGNTDSVSIVMTRMSNYLVFAMQLLMALYFVKFMFDLLGEYGIIAAKRIEVMAKVAILVDFILMTVNLFTGIAYYFDENNYYHRSTGWFFYTFILLAVMVTLIMYVISCRKKISKALLISILVCILIPAFSTCIQIFSME